MYTKIQTGIWNKWDHLTMFNSQFLTLKNVHLDLMVRKPGVCLQASHFTFPTATVLYSNSQFSSVKSLSHVWLFETPWTTARGPPCPSPSTRVYSNPCPLNWWCHPTISSSVFPFSYCPQSFPASGSSQMSQLFASGGKSIGVAASTSVLAMNNQDWSPLKWTGWISLQFKGLSRVFSNTTVQKHQFFCAKLSL